MPKLSSIYVPAEGPEDATIMCVGEAPGVEEEEALRPFIGKTGHLLPSFLQRHRIQREEVYLTNLLHYRPPGNKLASVLESPELADGLNELRADIERIDPVVILACGGWPMYYLTGKFLKNPGTGVLKWRNSVLPNTLVEDGPKVLVTVHPSYVSRNWSAHPFFNYDIGYLKKQAEFREIRYPQYEEIIDPSDSDLDIIVEEMLEADILSCDIETFGPGQLACIGFADSEDRGVCLTAKKSTGFEYARRLYEADVPKIFQYGTYDVSWLKFFFGWEVGGYGPGVGWDTYVAAATLMPEFKRGLGFLSSMYTDFPYFKDDGKIWKDEGDLNILWSYNLKDVIATYTIAKDQMKEMKEDFPS